MRKCLKCQKQTNNKKFCSDICRYDYIPPNAKSLNPNILNEYYHTQDMSVNDIAKILDVCPYTVYKYIKKYKIIRKKRYKDYTGQRVGNSLVLSLIDGDYKPKKWKVKCDCGIIFETTSGTIARSPHLSCKDCMYKSRRHSIRLTPYIWNIIVRGARERNIDILVSREEAYNLLVSQNYKCALTGIDIGYSDTTRGHVAGQSTASLDRIDNTLGYIEGNIQWVHKTVNMMKHTSNQDDFIYWCQLIAQHQKSYRKYLVESYS
jgi:predicted transcriptional regulator